MAGAFSFLVWMFVSSMKRISIIGENIIKHPNIQIKSKLPIELDYYSWKKSNEHALKINKTQTTNIYYIDDFIYIDTNLIMNSSRYEIPVLPLILCKENQTLRDRFPTNLIAEITGCHLTPWKSLKINAEMLWKYPVDIELNILFLENKDENAFKLKRIIEGMILP